MKVNTLKIPPEALELCTHWHDGQSSMMYAISSTGKLNISANQQPPQEVNTHEEWYYELYMELETEVSHSLRWIQDREPEHEDRALMEGFYEWIQDSIKKMEREFNLYQE